MQTRLKRQWRINLYVLRFRLIVIGNALLLATIGTFSGAITDVGYLFALWLGNPGVGYLLSLLYEHELNRKLK
jgi:hypothetical protein